MSDELGNENLTNSIDGNYQEKMIPASQVNEIVKARLARERERSVENHQPHIDESMISRVVDERLANNMSEIMRRQEEQANIQTGQRILSDFTSNLKASSNQKDANSLISDLQSYHTDTQTAAILLVEKIDNSFDVMEELLNNPTKLMNFVGLHQSNPSKAKDAIKKLSESIKKNSDSLNNHPVNSVQASPHMKPSVLPKDNGNPRLYEGMTPSEGIEYFRKNKTWIK